MKIVEGLEKEFKNTEESLTKDYKPGPTDFPNDYMKAIFDGAVKIGNLLDDEINSSEIAFKEATKNEGYTGYMVGWMCSIVSRFHVRGKEFQKWWNIYNGGTGEEKGTINPAILTIKVKG